MLPVEAGKVSEIKVTNGDRVAKGDVLITFEPDEAKVDVDNLEAATPQKGVDMRAGLVPSGAGSKASAFDGQKFCNRLVKVRNRLKHMTLYSPADGTVQASNVFTIGQVGTAGQEIMRIVPPSIRQSKSYHQMPGLSI